MDHPIRRLTREEFPGILLEIPEPPAQLFLRGNLPPPEHKRLAVVGSRNYTNYGKRAVEYLVEGLRGYPISIISGLALGIDALAHEAALRAHLFTLAVPGSGLTDTVLYPRRNRALGMRILDAGGGLLSEFEPDFEATPWSFPQRNRIMAGLSHATLVIEAGERSGTLITARLTADYNRELLVVPGDIFSMNSRGPHQFLKLGAIPVTSPTDILEALHLEETVKEMDHTSPLSPDEERVLRALNEPRDLDTLTRVLALNASATGVLLMSMELKGLIRESNGIFYTPLEQQMEAERASKSSEMNE